jgi:hypothetical protein
MHRAELASIRHRVQAQNFARLAFNKHFERPAAYLAVRREPLARHTGVHDQVERLPAKRALDFSGNFHSQNSPDPACFATPSSVIGSGIRSGIA